MPDITITIGSPTIVAPAKFKTRYRELPSGTFSSNVDRDNTPFTLTGLSAGYYELEVIYVNAQGQDCPTILRTFEVIDDYPCVEFSAEIAQDESGIYYLDITFTAPSQQSPVGSDPPCGWEIEYTQGGGTVIIPYATLPASGIISIPVQNLATQLTIRAMMCNWKSKDCFDDEVPPAAGPCIPMVITSSEITQNPAPSIGYTIGYYYNQSVPVTKIINVSYQQTGVVQQSGAVLDSGVLPPGGVYPILGGAVFWTVVPTPVFGYITYVVKVIDICGTEHTFTVTYG